MIRKARHQDIPALMPIYREMFARSKYVGRGELSEKAVDHLLTGAIAQQGQFGPQGTLVVVAEENGKIVGLLIGILDRCYGVGNKLTAQDYHFYVQPSANVRASLGLVDAYVEWAGKIRACVEIDLSWSDAIPGAEKIAAMAKRKGFKKIGEIFEMRLDAEARKEAA